MTGRIVDHAQASPHVGFEFGLGHTGLLKIKLIEKAVLEDLAEQFDARHRPAAEVRHAEPDNGTHMFRMKQSRAVGDRRAPVVAYDDGPFRAERCDQPVDICAHVLDRIRLDGVRLVAAAIATHIRYGNPIAGVHQRRNLMAPRVPTLGKAVDQDDEGTLAGQCHPEADAIGLDDLQVRFHATSSARYGAQSYPGSGHLCLCKPQVVRVIPPRATLPHRSAALLQGREENDEAERTSGASRFFVGTLRETPGLDSGSPQRCRRRPVPSIQARQEEDRRSGRSHARDARHAGRLAHRHRAGVRHRRRRDGAVVAARRPAGRRAGLGELRRGLGHRRRQAAQAQGHAHAEGAPTASSPTSARSTGRTTSSSPGTARPRACGCRTATGSPTTARA